LIEAGITTYAQVANLSEEEAADFKVKAEAIAEAKELAGA
jgi:predicted flap endonuclease-1-like 5' DNA nuclease